MRAAVSLRYDDDAARRRIRTSLDESLLVEASAGTGKTSEMVRRIVAVLARGLTRIPHVAAVTFTRKAAGELKLRLRRELDQARNDAADPAAQAHLEDALAHLEEARVGTIHSFCAEILRERPVEAVIDPAFQELSDYEARQVYARAFRSWVQDKLAASSPGLRRALARLARVDSRDPRPPLDKLQDAGWKLLEWRDFPTPWRREPFDRESEIDFLVGAARSLDAMAAQSRYSTDTLVQALRPARDFATWVERSERGGDRDYDTLEALLVQLLRDLRRDRKKTGKGAFAPGLLRERVVEARDALLARLESFQQRSEADLAAVLRVEMWDLVARYDDLKRQAGALDFVDLLLRVRNLLRDNPAVRRHLQQQFSHLFIDEFQDTDPLQAEILILLSADDPDETNWLQVTPVPGKLFLVGDPKQSIYRFRRADVVLYQAVAHALRERGVEVVYLTRSFRAVAPIQDSINAAFEPEMQENPLTGQPHYVPLEHYAPALDGQPSLIALPVPYPYGGRGVQKDQVKAGLPSLVAAFVHWLIRDSGWTVRDPEHPDRRIPIEERHVCLLFRHYISDRSDSTREYLHALESRGLRHVLVGQRSFHQREEVETLRAALAAIEWPDDELSVFATLRGSLFAIPDSTLLRYRLEVGPLNPFQAGGAPTPRGLGVGGWGLGGAEGAAGAIAEALGLLQRLHRRRNYRPIVETLSELLEAARAHAGFALRPAGHQVLANVYRVLDLARSFELNGGISFRGFVEELEAQAERPSSGDAPAVEESTEGVRVMTAHTAKGLEFPVVLLADVTTRISWDRPDMYVDAQQGLCAVPLIGCTPWDLLDHQQDEAARDLAEGVRVAYVAATRARDLLVVPALGDGRIEESWVSPLYKVLYPAPENRRNPQPAPGCPAFGPTTVLGTPPNYHGDDTFAIRPGLHDGVVWWDPALLPLKVEANLGLRLETVLAEDPGGETAHRSLSRYQDWQRHRESAILQGGRPRFSLFTPTDTKGWAPPQDFQPRIELAALDRSADRPYGPRFGTLVHTLLRDATLEIDSPRISSLATLHGRVLGATGQEIAAAIDAVLAALTHPLIERARAAPRCHRELPILLRLDDDDRLLEGIIDLAFLEDGAWTIVDFKTDAHLTQLRPRYERQLVWYVYAMTRLTGLPASGCLFSL